MKITDTFEPIYLPYYSFGEDPSGTGTFVKKHYDFTKYFGSFINPYLTIVKYNWTCKSCEQKITDPVQVVTNESHRPCYHVNCFEQLYDRMLELLLNNRKTIMSQIENIRDDLTPAPIQFR